MLLLLVRHGRAGSKQHWRGDDRLRPLTKLGFAESDALVGVLTPYEPGRVISSPFLRCIQTVSPLAEALGLPIEQTERLIPSASESAESFAREASPDATRACVICTHGEVIHDLQRSLRRQTPPLFVRDQRREKGSVWVLDRVAGRFVSAEYIAPPTRTH